MARALIVGCGQLGTQLGLELQRDGFAVRGTSRSAEGADRIDKSGLEGVVADPDRVGTVLEHVGDVAIVVWALGAVTGDTAKDANSHRLERVLEKLVDTPVRGFVLDAPGDQEWAPSAIAVAEQAEATWRIPVRAITTKRSDGDEWTQAASQAVKDLLA